MISLKTHPDVKSRLTRTNIAVIYIVSRLPPLIFRFEQTAQSFAFLSFNLSIICNRPSNIPSISKMWRINILFPAWKSPTSWSINFWTYFRSDRRIWFYFFIVSLYKIYEFAIPKRTVSSNKSIIYNALGCNK